MGDDPVGSDEALAHQMLARGDEIGEAVGLVGELALAVPAPALLGAAAYVGDGIDEAAIDQGQARGREPRRDRDAIGAIAIEQAGRRAVERGILSEQQRDGHQFAVRRGRHDPAGDVACRIVTGRHLLALAQDPLARRKVVVPHLGRRGHGRIIEAHQRLVETIAGVEAERIGFLGEFHSVLDSRFQRTHHDAREAVLALEPHQMPAKGGDGEDQPAGLVRHQLAPVGARGRGERRGDDLEVLRPVRIGLDEEALRSLEVRMVLDAVSQPDGARLDEARGRLDVLEVEEMDLAGLVVAAGDQAETAGLGAAERDEEALVRLFIDQHVGGRVGADDMAIDEARPVLGVAPHIIEVVRIRAPQYVAGGLGDTVGQVASAGEVAHPQGEIFRAGFVSAPGEPAMVGRMAGIAELEERLAFGERVAVEQHGAGSLVSGGAAADQRMLAAFPEPGVIGKRPVGRRDGGIVLLDAPAHLGDEAALERLVRGEPRLRRGILAVEKGADGGIEHARVAHALAPVLGAQPRIGIDEGLAMEGPHQRRRCGRSGERRLLSAHRMPRRLVPSRPA